MHYLRAVVADHSTVPIGVMLCICVERVTLAPLGRYSMWIGSIIGYLVQILFIPLQMLLTTSVLEIKLGSMLQRGSWLYLSIWQIIPTIVKTLSWIKTYVLYQCREYFKFFCIV